MSKLDKFLVYAGLASTLGGGYLAVDSMTFGFNSAAKKENVRLVKSAQQKAAAHQTITWQEAQAMQKSARNEQKSSDANTLILGGLCFSAMGSKKD